MSNHLAVVPQDEFQSFASRLVQLIYLLCDDALDCLWYFITKKSKLERMLGQAESLRATRLLELENFLTRKLIISKHKVFRSHEEFETMLHDGNVSAEGEERETLKLRLESAVATIDAYDDLCSKVESVRKEKYDSNNPVHEEKLRRLWDIMMPEEPLSERIGKQWRYIGFQGDDPATDFRGMGVLSLDQLIYLNQYHPDDAQRILSISHHPTIGFPMAVAGITFTAVTRQLLASGRLKRFFYHSEDPIGMNLFHETYCRIFTAFVEYWKKANPSSVMEFNPVKAVFERKLFDELAKEDADILSLSN